MPGTKEIRTKIASVKSTQKITKAMQMVATSKMRRAQDRMRAARPYAEKMRNVIGHLTEANPGLPASIPGGARAKGVGIILVSTDRGLAGGLNANVFKQTLQLMREWQGKGAEVSLCLIGTKGLVFFRRLTCRSSANVDRTGRPAAHQGSHRYRQGDAGCVPRGEIDRLFLVNAHFVNTMTQTPTVDQLLPVEAIDIEGLAEHWDYIYEPEA